MSSSRKTINFATVDNTKEKVLCYCMNQDKSCLAVGTTKGYKIYSTKSYRMIGEKELGGGIGRICMLYKSNLLLLSGGGDNPRFSTRALVFWDDSTNVSTGELKFKRTIFRLVMRKDL
jgi:hypothetical protein